MSTLEIRPDGFYFAGQPFRLIGGAMHYFRIPRACWRDRLLKLKALGCNTVETYVAWNAHEPYPGQFEFGEMLDIVAFCRIAEEVGLHVIVRPGPYICAEWDFGGLPGWLMADADMRIRCSYPAYLKHVDRWFEQLLPRLVPLLATHGGPIIAMQFENEYGYFGNDVAYLTHLRDKMKSLGVDVPLFSSDGTYQRLTIATGGLEGHLRTANFGSDAPARLAVLREFQPDGPAVCMEFWVGWFDTWGDARHHTRSAQDTAASLDQLLGTGAGANIYMFHGGTNFGFSAGGNLSEQYNPYVTSYDYDALLDECGDITSKYESCREVLHRHLGSTPAPHGFAPSNKGAFGDVTLRPVGTLSSLVDAVDPVRSAVPMSFEQLGHSNGYVLYRTTLSAIYRGERLVIRGMHDWCNIFVDGKSIATWYRNDPMPETKLDFAGDSGRLEILVHNLGRSNFGFRAMERKGITEGVFVGPRRLDERALFGWENFALPMNAAPTTGTWVGEFDVDEPADTFLRLDGFRFGCAFLNGRNLGRYWHVGPQRTLFVPASWLVKGHNRLCVFEADAVSDPTARFVDNPQLG
jgi:beta-galactosidase